MSINIDQLINEHDRRIQIVETENQHKSKQVDDLIGELKNLSVGLSENVIAFRTYTAHHDNLKESNSKLWRKFDESEKVTRLEIESIKTSINAINITNSGNQQVIDDVKSIKNKAMLIVTAAVLSPIAVGASVFFGK